MWNRRFWTHGAGSYALAILIALTIRWAFMEAYVIPSGSMLPSLLIRDHIFVNKLVYGIRFPFSEKWLAEFGKPKRGEVIVFKVPTEKSTFYIKRVVGIPGDKILYEDGKLFINDEPMPLRDPGPKDNYNYSFLRDSDFQKGGMFLTIEDFEHKIEDLFGVEHDVLLQKGEYLGVTQGPWVVPENQLFVMGDNRNRSKDSRYELSYVPEDYVLGRAMFVWLSCEETLPVVSFLCNPLTIRWKRFFHQVK
ncbi:MAG: signal peptidase I [Bdellovibrionales bacterium]|nr:signal peptidase I [Bdellovibrionales bacterium]